MASEPVERLSMDDIIRAAKDLRLRRKAAKWTVVVDGEELAARPLVLAAAGVPPNDPTNSHQAIAKLRQLGFETRYEGEPFEPESRVDGSDRRNGRAAMGRVGKYAPLNAFVTAHPVLPLTLSFDQVNLILGFRLPPTANSHVEWWGNEDPTKTRHTHSLAWTTAGLRAKPDLAGQTVTFSN